MSFVVDASAVLAVLFNETGKQAVIDHGRGGWISAINLTEVLTRAIDKQVPPALRNDIVGGMGLSVMAFDAAAAAATAELREPTRHLGLSLADRACLQLAMQLGVPVLTGDRAWGDLDIDVEIKLIR